MASGMSSKAAAAYLIDPLNAPEPSAETGLGAHFTSTFAPAHKTTSPTTSSPQASLSSNNPFREGSSHQRSASGHQRSTSGQQHSPSGHHRTSSLKKSPVTSERPLSAHSNRSSPRERFPDYRADAFGDSNSAPRRSSQPPPSYDAATSVNNSPTHRHRRRTSSLKERYPGDRSHEPLEILRRDSKKAYRSPHLRKHHLPGADTIDRLDPAIAGRAYHHEGPYDAALLARNTSYDNSPIAALQSSNEEALKATPEENIKDAVERHHPLDGTAIVPPGMSDRFGRTYHYQEGDDLMHETNNDGPGYKRWAGETYSPDDLKGESEPMFSLDKALRAHKISGDGIEMQEGTNRSRRAENDPVLIAGGESKYTDLELAKLAQTNDRDTGVRRNSSLRDGLKKRIGSLRKKKADE